MATVPQDSELQHSFAPGEIGFDFLPLEVPAGMDPAVPTTPSAPVPAIDLEGDGPLPELGALPSETTRPEPMPSRLPVRSSSRARSAGEIWLEGNSILCGCPDCRAPMTIRVWLMVADCWRCRASIELSEEQEREVQRLMAERGREGEGERGRVAAPRFKGAPSPSPLPPVPTPANRQIDRETERQREQPSSPPLPLSHPPTPPPTTTNRQSDGETERRREADAEIRPSSPPPVAPPTARREPRPPAPPRPPSRAAARPTVLRESWISRLFQDTPAWLISMLFHVVLVTILALLFAEGPLDDEGESITLSTVVDYNVREGGDTVYFKSPDEAQFDLPLPNWADLKNETKRAALLADNQDARELRLTSEEAGELPDVKTVRSMVGRPDGYKNGLFARDPRLRVEMVTQEGGTTQTEAAVARGLRWLANHQNNDGSWSLSGFSHAGNCNCNGDGSFSGKSPGTALAMLPFLGAGQTHMAGKYKGQVSRGVRWFLQHQGDDGDLRAGATGNEGMYTHGQAAIVLCEAFAMTGDEALRVPAQKAIDFIVAAQYRDGGWRYQPGPRSQRGDTSVVGWQLMALQSARAANLTVPDETWGMADLYLDSVQHQEGSLYSYQAGGSPTNVMTAEALLCRMYLGWTADRPGLIEGVQWLSENHLPSQSRPNHYYWYYGTQVMHHHGGPEWDEWNLKMRDILCESQVTRGHAAGSWDPRGEHSGAGGRIYVTSLAICTLEVYYRHLPIFRQIKLAR